MDWFLGQDTESEIDRLEAKLGKLQEAADMDAASRKLMSRRLEDLTYKYLDAVATNEDDHPENRRKIIRRAYRYWAEDPIVGQSLNLLTWYTFGRGVPMPTIPKRDSIEEVDRQSALDVIKEFWDAPENKAVITSLESQEQKSLELQIEGEVFIAMFDGGAGSPLLLSDIVDRQPEDAAVLRADVQPEGLRLRHQAVPSHGWQEGRVLPALASRARAERSGAARGVDRRSRADHARRGQPHEQPAARELRSSQGA
jgi:hypothetical protein